MTKQGIEDMIRRLETPDELEQCQNEIKKMLEIEADLLWWAQSGKCCMWQAGAYLTGNTHLLEDVLTALHEGDTAQASSLLREYARELNEVGERTIIF